jgi:hypothetical protein
MQADSPPKLNKMKVAGSGTASTVKELSTHPFPPPSFKAITLKNAP